MSSPMSLSDAATVPTVVWFSAGFKVVEEVNDGAALVVAASRSRTVTVLSDDQSRSASQR